VRVWLIAVASFQHGHARAQFADIWLEDAERKVRVEWHLLKRKALV
jgi:hypothetical protein